MQQIPPMALCMLYTYSNHLPLLAFISLIVFSNLALTFPVEGIPLAPLNLKLEFWVTMPSCYGIMRLRCRIIV